MFRDSPLPARAGGEVLFASRDLEPIFLDPNVWHSPCLLRGSTGQLTWFWRCDLAFLSWVDGVVASAGDRLPPHLVERVAFVRSCVCAQYGMTDDNWPDRMVAAGLPLDTSFLASALGVVDFDLAPPWPGLDVAARAAGYSDPLPFRFQGRAALDDWATEQTRASRPADDDDAAKPKKKRS